MDAKQEFLDDIFNTVKEARSKNGVTFNHKQDTTLKQELSYFYAKIQDGTAFSSQSDVWEACYSSSKFNSLNPGHKKAFIEKMGLANFIMQALFRNPNFINIFASYKSEIESTVEEINDTELSKLFIVQKALLQTKILNALDYPKEYKERVLAVGKNLSSQYQLNEKIRAFVNFDISQPLIESATPFVTTSPMSTILIGGTVYSIGCGIQMLIKQQIPEKQKPIVTEIDAQIAKIENPLQRLNSILPELTADNITSVSDTTLGRLFDTSVAMAVCDEFNINERFKPLLKSLEIMPNDKFESNSVINNQRVFIVTDLIKNTIDLKRGDIATELMTHSIPKISNNNPELMRCTNEISNSFRKELSDITVTAIVLSKEDMRLNPVDKRKPLGKLLEFTTDTTIPEFASYDPTEPMDIPVTGYLPEIIHSTLHDLRQGETETLKSLIKHASENNPDHIVTGNDIFNGQDKKILVVMLDTLSRSLNPNPLNKVMSDFLTLYTAGHFAEGGGFSDTVNDGYTTPIKVLDRLVNVVNSQTQYNNQPTILEHIENKFVQQGEIIGDNKDDKRCDFKKAYRTSDGMVNMMKIRFNQCPPKPFKTSITDNTSKHRIFGG